jgi:Ulp1 family protease
VEDQDSDCFCLVIVDFSRKKIFYLDPQFENLEDQPHERAHFVCDLLNRFLDHNMEEIAHGRSVDFTMTMSVDGGMHFPRQQNDFDSGMYVFFFAYFSVFESPIFFDNDDIIRMRKQLAYWILKEYLPM